MNQAKIISSAENGRIVIPQERSLAELALKIEHDLVALDEQGYRLSLRNHVDSLFRSVYAWDILGPNTEIGAITFIIEKAASSNTIEVDPFIPRLPRGNGFGGSVLMFLLASFAGNYRVTMSTYQDDVSRMFKRLGSYNGFPVMIVCWPGAYLINNYRIPRIVLGEVPKSWRWWEL